jgi:hypothetical protein
VDSVEEQVDMIDVWFEWVNGMGPARILSSILLQFIYNLFIFSHTCRIKPNNQPTTMSERGLVMALHSVIIGAVLYAIMTFLFQQSAAVAENRSICIAAAVLIYMIVFGHGLPGRINPQL